VIIIGTMTQLALRGHRSIAVDLPGRGAGFSAAYHGQDLETFATEPSTLAGVTAAETIRHVVDVVNRVREHGPVVLVGHSLGGIVLTTTELVGATAGIMVGNPAELGVLRLNWRGADGPTVATLKAAMAAELTDQQFIGELGACQPDEVAWPGDPEWDHRARKDTWGRVPHTVVRLTEDRAMPPAAQDRYVTEADSLTPDNPFEVHSIRSSHTGFFVRPHELVDILTGGD
jgi:pimeloyl-ACP methyl ester carboxylesterase